MKTEPKNETAGQEKPRNKANMDQPQEEFIQPGSAYAEHDRERGQEVKQSRVDRCRDGQKE